MRDYFNQQERSRHLLVLFLTKTAEEFLDGNAITDEERKQLDKGCKAFEKFHELVMERLGGAYARSLQGTFKLNKVTVSPNATAMSNIISYQASEDIAPMCEEFRLYKCADCEKKDYKDCGFYNCCVSCNLEGNQNEKGECPFRL